MMCCKQRSRCTSLWAIAWLPENGQSDTRDVQNGLLRFEPKMEKEYIYIYIYHGRHQSSLWGGGRVSSACAQVSVCNKIRP